MEQAVTLFDKVPDKIFRPLAATNRRFYAALLLHLYEHTFSAIGDTPRRADVISELGDYIDRYTRQNGALEQGDEDVAPLQARALVREAKSSDTQDLRRYFTFQYLVDCGWLTESRDRFRKLVDLSAEGRLLLREIQKIVQGDTRSYGGAVLNVLGALDAAVAFPDDRSEAIRNAWSFSSDFSHHLRSLSSRMRRIEDHVLSQDGLRAVFQAFFDEFVADMLIADYKTLKTRNNPFRFRHNILQRVTEIEGDADLMVRLCSAYVREGRAADEVSADLIIRRELHDVYRLFDTIDRHLEVISETQQRIERKIHTIVRYMDRHDGGAVERATAAIRALGATGVRMETDVPTDPCLLLLDPLLGGDILYNRRQVSRGIDRSMVRETHPDPAFEAFRLAKLDYARQVTVSPQRVRAFLNRILEGRDSVTGSEISVETVDDFIVFQRLRDVPFMFDGALARDFSVTPLNRRACNSWLDFPDFTVTRAKTVTAKGPHHGA